MVYSFIASSGAPFFSAMAVLQRFHSVSSSLPKIAAPKDTRTPEHQNSQTTKHQNIDTPKHQSIMADYHHITASPCTMTLRAEKGHKELGVELEQNTDCPALTSIAS